MQAVALAGSRVILYDRHAPPRGLPPHDLRVCTFNIHQMRGRDRYLPNGKREKGANQFWEIVSELKAQRADVLLLQEVPPQYAENLVRTLGMDGYFCRTVPRQGNMILLPSGTVVRENVRVLINPELAATDEASIRKALETHENEHRSDVARQFLEPRAVQMLKLDGLVLWNTHLTAGTESNRSPDGPETLGERRRKEALELADAVQAFAAGMPILGGGDLNSKPTESVWKALQEKGFRGYPDQAGSGIDWILTLRLPELSVVNNQSAYNGGLQISDHPVLTVQLP